MHMIMGQVKHQSSEEVPKYWDQGPVKQLVGKNFHLVVFDKERDVFVMFYAPWSAVCRALFPVLEELGLRYQNHSTLTIAKIDITANDVPLTDQGRYPFFRLFPTNSQPAVPYKGEHTVRGFSDFLESQIQTRLQDAAELSSVEPSEEVGEEALAKQELPEQKSPELGNVTRLEEPGQEAAAEEEGEGAKPKGPPGRRKRPGVKVEL
uniref:Protein disulfide isomerase like, testis expressed n=1 Tax=Molossus molossus TaxID=27622 RepID=A0A7J8J2C0_MOLMO|nr:protein disulfide isomerase like, testis expressed [Molossus molossus]